MEASGRSGDVHSLEVVGHHKALGEERRTVGEEAAHTAVVEVVRMADVVEGLHAVAVGIGLEVVHHMAAAEVEGTLVAVMDMGCGRECHMAGAAVEEDILDVDLVEVGILLDAHNLEEVQERRHNLAEADILEVFLAVGILAVGILLPNCQ